MRRMSLSSGSQGTGDGARRRDWIPHLCIRTVPNLKGDELFPLGKSKMEYVHGDKDYDRAGEFR